MLRDYVLIKEQSLRGCSGFVPIERASISMTNKFKGKPMPMGFLMNLTCYPLDGDVLEEIKDNVEAHWQSEYDLLLEDYHDLEAKLLEGEKEL